MLFVDAVHFVYKAYLGFICCFCRVFIKSPSGRQRFNVLGALNALTHELISVTNTTYINAESFCELLKKIASRYRDKLITLVLDNARYQKCEVVRQMAESLGIELVYLPSYSPNLNLIERFWKFVKKQCLYSKYYPEFKAFRGAISEFLDQAPDKHKKELESLLTLRFQTFRKTEIMTV